MAGAMPRVIRVLIHCYPPVGQDAQHVYLGEAARAAPGPAGRPVAHGGRYPRRPWPSSSPRRSTASPSIPPPRATRRRARSRCWPPTSRPTRRCPRSSRRSRARSPASTAIPTRPTPRCARRWRTATASRRNRIAIGNGSCDILLAAGEALLEPGAEIVYAWPSFSVYPHLAAASGARAIQVPLDAEHRHDLDAMRSEITAATRLVIVCNPNNPTSTALPLDEIAAFVADVPRHVAVILDEAYCEFSLLDDPDASLELLKRHQNLVLLRTFSKVHGLCGLRVGFGLCGSEALPHRGRPGAPAVLLQRRRPGRRRRGARATRTRSRAASSATSPSAWASRTGCASSGSRPPTRRRTSSGSTSATGADEADVLRGLAERARAGARRRRRSGAPGALRVTVGTAADNQRFLDALGALLPARR